MKGVTRGVLSSVKGAIVGVLLLGSGGGGWCWCCSAHGLLGLVCVQRMGSWFWCVLRYDVIRGSLGKREPVTRGGSPDWDLRGSVRGVVGARPGCGYPDWGAIPDRGPRGKRSRARRSGESSPGWSLRIWASGPGGILPCFALCRARLCVLEATLPCGALAAGSGGRHGEQRGEFGRWSDGVSCCVCEV